MQKLVAIYPSYGLNLCEGLLPSVVYKVQNLPHLHFKTTETFGLGEVDLLICSVRIDFIGVLL